MVFVINLANLAQLISSGFVVQMAHQGVAGIRRHGHNAAFGEQRDRLLQQTRLRVVGMDFKKL